MVVGDGERGGVWVSSSDTSCRLDCWWFKLKWCVRSVSEIVVELGKDERYIVELLFDVALELGK